MAKVNTTNLFRKSRKVSHYGQIFVIKAEKQ